MGFIFSGILFVVIAFLLFTSKFLILISNSFPRASNHLLVFYGMAVAIFIAIAVQIFLWSRKIVWPRVSQFNDAQELLLAIRSTTDPMKKINALGKRLNCENTDLSRFYQKVTNPDVNFATNNTADTFMQQ